MNCSIGSSTGILSASIFPATAIKTYPTTMIHQEWMKAVLVSGMTIAAIGKKTLPAMVEFSNPSFVRTETIQTNARKTRNEYPTIPRICILKVVSDFPTDRNFCGVRLSDAEPRRRFEGNCGHADTVGDRLSVNEHVGREGTATAEWSTPCPAAQLD